MGHPYIASCPCSNCTEIRGLPKDSAVKHDQDKVRYDLLPPEFIYATAAIMTFGVKKYGDRNWEKGLAWSRLFRAAIGHLWDWWRMAGDDPETKRSHLWHAACCVAMLIASESRQIGEDDRPPLNPSQLNTDPIV